MTLFPLWNPFHVLIVAIVLQYLLILIHTILLAWMIVYIMANARTLHAKLVLKRRRYSSSVLHVWPPIIIDLFTDQLTSLSQGERNEVLRYPRNFFDRITGGLPKDEEAASCLWGYRKGRPNNGSGNADLVSADGGAMLKEMKDIRESL